MLLVTYAGPEPRLGFLWQDHVFDIASTWTATGRTALPPALTMNNVIVGWERWAAGIEQCWQRLSAGEAPEGKPRSAVRVLSPIPQPVRNPFGIAGNYLQHVVRGEEKSGVALTQRKRAMFFTKSTLTVIGPEDAIEYDPTLTQQVDYELELAVVIGRAGKDISEAQAMSHVFGYTVANDISARDIQVVKPQIDYLRGKGLDTFFPLGPGIVPRGYLPDYQSCAMRLFVNDELRQSGTPAQMMRDIPQIIEELSRGMTLVTGDIIATGTPSGVAYEMPEPRYLQDGDIVRAEIDGIGALVNPVRARSVNR